MQIFLLGFTVSDTLDDIMTESGDEEETEGIVNKVLDEIGIEISGKVRKFILFLFFKAIIVSSKLYLLGYFNFFFIL